MPGRDDFAIIRARLLADARAHDAAARYVDAGIAVEVTSLATVVGHVGMLGLWASRETDNGVLPGDGVVPLQVATSSPRSVSKSIVECLTGAGLLRPEGDGLYIVGFADCYAVLFRKRERDRESAAAARAKRGSRGDVGATSELRQVDIGATVEPTNTSRADVGATSELRRSDVVPASDCTAAVPLPLPLPGRTAAVSERQPYLNPSPAGEGLDALRGLVAKLPATADATAMLDALHGAVTSAGWKSTREWSVPDRGDGRPGRIDLLVTAPHRIAIECDRMSPRGKSLLKLRQVPDALRVVVLREDPGVDDRVVPGFEIIVAPQPVAVTANGHGTNGHGAQVAVDRAVLEAILEFLAAGRCPMTVVEQGSWHKQRERFREGTLPPTDASNILATWRKRQAVAEVVRDAELGVRRGQRDGRRRAKE